MKPPARGTQEQKSIDQLVKLGIPENRARKTKTVEAARKRDIWDERWTASLCSRLGDLFDPAGRDVVNKAADRDIPAQQWGFLDRRHIIDDALPNLGEGQKVDPARR